MDIGKPQRIHRVEPLKVPVPKKPAPAAPPEKRPVAPKEVPVK